MNEKIFYKIQQRIRGGLVKRKFRMLAGAVTCIMLISMVSGINAAIDETQIYAEFGEKLKTKNLNIKIGTDGKSPYSTVVKDGKCGLWVNTGDKYNSALYCDINDIAEKNITDYSSYFIEIEYFDDGYGHFFLKTDSRADKWEKTRYKTERSEIVRLNNTQKWLTHRFLVEKPRFANNVNSADFSVNLYDENTGTSKSGVAFGRISVYPSGTKSNIHSRILTEETANIFFTGMDIKLNTSIYNTLYKNQSIKAKLSVSDNDGNMVYTEEKSLEAKRYAEINNSYIFKPDKYGIYTAKLEIFADGVYSSSEAEFSYVASNYGRHPNERIGMNNHMTWMDRPPQMLMPLLVNSGFGYDRASGRWADIETSKRVFALTDLQKRTYDGYKEYGIPFIQILGEGNTLYGARFYLDDADFEDAYIRYVEYLVNEVKDCCDYYEIMNEVNTKTGVDAYWYAKMVRRCYETIKKIDPDAKIIAGVSSHVDVAFDEIVCREAKGYFDVYSIHPYIFYASPEEGKYYEYIMPVRNILNKYGLSDIPIWITENGYSSATNFVTEEEQAKFLARMCAVSMDSTINCEKLFIYDFLDDWNRDWRGNEIFYKDERECNWGLLRNVDAPNYIYSAKPAFLSMAAYNYIMADTDYIDKALKDDVYIYHFRRGYDKKDILMMWSADENRSISVKLDVAEIIDMNGNKCDIQNNGGVYSFPISGEPVYVISDSAISEIDAVVCENPEFAVDSHEIAIPYGDSGEITVKFPCNGDYNVNFEIPDNRYNCEINIGENKDGVAKINVSGKGVVGEKDDARVFVTSNEKIVYETMVTLNYIDRIDVEFTALPYSESYLSRWTGTVTVTNNSKTTPASGEVLLSSQQLLNGIDKKIIFNYIGAGQSQSYSFNLPEVGRGMEYSDVNIAVSLENGYVRETKADFGTTMAAYAKRKPVIDGVLSDGEWETRLPVMLDKNSVFELTSGAYSGSDDLAANVYLEWDEENLYIAANVTDDVFLQEHDGNMMWMDDSIQIGVSGEAVNNSSYTSYTELCVGLTKNGVQINKSSNDSGVGKAITDSKAEINNKGTETIYEIKLPWDEIISDDVKVKAGNVLRFNLMVNDNDGAGRWGWVIHTPGMGNKKNSQMFAYMLLYSEELSK